ncbi:MAG: hypothetical protein ACI8ZM_003676 [Crocinitomix sp.]|jgi:hypothetical protein
MLSLKKCRELLGETGKKWTDEKIEQVRNYLMKLARINVEIIKNLKSKRDDASSNNV